MIAVTLCSDDRHTQRDADRAEQRATPVGDQRGEVNSAEGQPSGAQPVHQYENLFLRSLHLLAKTLAKQLETAAGRIVARVGHALHQEVQAVHHRGALGAQLVGHLLAACLVLLHLLRGQTVLHAVGAIHAPQQARQAFGNACLESVVGPPSRVRSFDQGGKIGRVLAQGDQGLVPLARVDSVA